MDILQNYKDGFIIYPVDICNTCIINKLYIISYKCIYERNETVGHGGCNPRTQEAEEELFVSEHKKKTKPK